MDSFLSSHKARHLLSHVLVVAGARHWPQATLGDSGESATGFYADFGNIPLPSATDLEDLLSDMVRLLADVRTFKGIELSHHEARSLFARHPWKKKEIAVLHELDRPVRAYDLDGFLDLCDCVLKDPRELRQIHPERFLLTGSDWVVWQDRSENHRLVRISGELFPAPPPCDCCLG